MVDRPRSRDGEPKAGMSRWVKVTLIVLAIAALIAVVMVVANSGSIGGHQIPEHAPPSAVSGGLFSIGSSR